MTGATDITSVTSLTDSEGESESDVENNQIQMVKCSSFESVDQDARGIVLQDDDSLPTFGNISVMNSSDVHFGNKTVYQGPVIIKQFVYPDGLNPSECNVEIEKKKSEDSETDGVDNPGFVSDNGVKKDVNNVNKVVVSPQDTNSRCGFPGIRKGFIWLQNIPKQRPFEIAMFLVVLVLSIFILLLVLFWKRPTALTSVNETQNFSSTDTDEQDKNTPTDYFSEIGNNTVFNKLRIVSRLEWLAQPAKHPVNPLVISPAPFVIIQHTATENCSSQAQCVFHVRFIQTFHLESRDFWDIGYNFLVGGDGAAYEGRGWTKEGAHTYGYNSKSIGIAFIGTFIDIKPPVRQIIACQKLIEMGVKKGYIREDYKVLAARQLSGTESPGLALYEDIKTWPHWSETP